MTLESAERLVEKILQQLQVKYEATGDARHDHDHESDHHHGEEERSIVVEPQALETLPPELRPFVSTRSEPAE